MRFDAFIAAGLASLVAGDEVLACPVPAVCDCSIFEAQVKNLSSEHQRCVESKAAELSKRDATLAALNTDHIKQRTETQVQLEQHQKSAREWQTRVADLEKQVSTLQTQAAKAKEADAISRQLSTLEQTHKESLQRSASELSSLKTAYAMLQKQSNEDVASCQKSQDTLRSDYESYKGSVAQYETRYAELQKQNKQADTELTELRLRLDPLVNVVYSKNHVEYAYTHVVRIGKAFWTFAKRRFTNAVGQDFINLVNLQAAVWGQKAQVQAKELGMPLLAQAMDLYHEKLEAHCGPFIGQAMEFADKQWILLKDLGSKFLTLTEHSMDRVVRNLSTVDPTIGEVFGRDFTDRCFAFAFVLLCFWVASTIVGWLFSTFVSTPVCWVFGIGKSKKKVKKLAGSKTAKGDQKGKIGVKNAPNVKEGLKGEGKVVAKEGMKGDGKVLGNKADIKKAAEKAPGDLKAAKKVPKP